jgi:5-methyltetrahydropteroyltriglutamate--homocysteine methyltransferase
MSGVARTDVVGSLLRPPELLDARRRWERGELDAAGLKQAEDRAVDGAVAMQEEAGLDVVTDGEMRRLSFQSGLPEAVAGFGEVPLDAYLWGDWHGDAVGDRSTERPAGLGVKERLVRRRHIAAEDFTYLRGRTSRIAKVTLTSPSLYANLWSPDVSRDAYPTLDDFLADVVALTRDEVTELARLGATYIQLDAPHYPLLIDPATRAFYESRGWSVERWLAHGIELDNAVMDGHPGVTFGFHLCRGNQGSRWLVAGGYGPIAGQVFRDVHADRLLLEYDDDRSGSFQPLREVPDDRVVVLGLVTTKSGRLEDAGELEGRIREAAREVDLERLAISPQCGFATSVVGNALTREEQAAKLRLLAAVRDRVWG